MEGGGGGEKRNQTVFAGKRLAFFFAPSLLIYVFLGIFFLNASLPVRIGLFSASFILSVCVSVASKS